MFETEADTAAESLNTKKKNYLSVAILLLIILFFIVGPTLVWALNHFFVDRPLKYLLAEDERNHSVKASAHWGGWIDPNELVFNVDGLTDKASRLDVFRVFLQYADAVKNKRYSRVILASQGRSKFSIDGAYFQELGDEYSTQNPMYTIRTFPPRVSTMDGTHPFHEYDGGLFVVLGAEMQQFSDFSDQWYLNDLRNSISTSPEDADSGKANFDPCESLREQDPHCGWKAHWEDSAVSVNAIDGTKTEFLTMESLDPDGTDDGDLHYATLKLCFDNGKLCGGKSIGVGVRVHGMLDDSDYNTAVRYKFDDGSPVRQAWGVSDDHEMLFPFGREKQFAAELGQHRKLILEFSYFEKAPRTVNFDLTGLDAAMKSKGLNF